MATGAFGGGVGLGFGLQDRAEGMDAILEKHDLVWKHEEGGA